MPMDTTCCGYASQMDTPETLFVAVEGPWYATVHDSWEGRTEQDE